MRQSFSLDLGSVLYFVDYYAGGFMFRLSKYALLRLHLNFCDSVLAAVVPNQAACCRRAQPSGLTHTFEEILAFCFVRTNIYRSRVNLPCLSYEDEFEVEK